MPTSVTLAVQQKFHIPPVENPYQRENDNKFMFLIEETNKEGDLCRTYKNLRLFLYVIY